MATLFSGERLASVIGQITDSGVGTYYTVPAGRWAKIKILTAGFAGTSNGNDLSIGIFTFSTQYNSTGGAPLPVWSIEGVKVEPSGLGSPIVGAEFELILTSGETVAGNDAGINVTFQVVEYFNP